MLDLTPVSRSFLFDGRTLPDPGPEYAPADVLRLYMTQFPDLAQAEVLPATPGGVIEFKKSFGSKG
ncbi:PRTRC system protein C [Deinococcus multiflagellatus]|uniref:PRTRC system protein C n=1 Tax=Deinococcus multiflagellatus TaxID=1656887 RepID=A0ABW1ZSA8_9DEIO|nr:PRTRC system protein C [Deinococcus multiflagellatus]MBZ9714475.1 PRTRC system protein C [Deinococcus multiflagellatus]